MRRVSSDHVDVQREGNEDQAGKNRRAASDNDEEVVPLVWSIFDHDARVLVEDRPWL